MPVTRPNRKYLEKARRETDHKRLDAMTDAEITAAAESDPDNPPLDDSMLKALRFAGFVQKVRAASGLSQAQFARTYEIPIGTLRDWEQGRVEPDQAARAYLMVIARIPDAVREALDAAA